MFHSHIISFCLMVVLSAILFAGSSMTLSTTGCLDVLPSLPLCAQCPGQNILLIGNCPTTDIASCVCKDVDLTSQFFDQLYQACSPPYVEGTGVYGLAAQKFIDKCAKEGYTISDSKHGGKAPGSTTTTGSAATPSSVPLLFSMSSTTTTHTSSLRQTAVSEPPQISSRNTSSTKAETETANTELISTSTNSAHDPGATPTSKSNAAGWGHGTCFGGQAGMFITGTVMVALVIGLL